jgi:hypothetical protein
MRAHRHTNVGNPWRGSMRAHRHTNVGSPGSMRAFWGRREGQCKCNIFGVLLQFINKSVSKSFGEIFLLLTPPLRPSHCVQYEWALKNVASATANSSKVKVCLKVRLKCFKLKINRLKSWIMNKIVKQCINIVKIRSGLRIKIEFKNCNRIQNIFKMCSFFNLILPSNLIAYQAEEKNCQDCIFIWKIFGKKQKENIFFTNCSLQKQN